jgi:hypothetical protein
MKFAVNVVAGILANERRSAWARRRATSQRAPDDNDDPDAPGSQPDPPASARDPEQSALAREEAELMAWRTARLRELLDGDALALQLVDLAEDGLDDDAEIAEVVGRSSKDIENARRRVRRQIENVLAEERRGARPPKKDRA